MAKETTKRENNAEKKEKKRTRAKDSDFQPNGKFAKGNTCGGRKEIPKDLKEMFRAASPDAVKLLVKTVNDPEASLQYRIKAAEIILDRHLGKPVQAVDLDAHSIPQVVFVGADAIPE